MERGEQKEEEEETKVVHSIKDMPSMTSNLPLDTPS